MKIIRLLLLVSISIFSGFNADAQWKSKVLIIDTLEGAIQNFEVIVPQPDTIAYEYLNIIDSIRNLNSKQKGNVNVNRHPNYQARIYYYSAYSQLILPLDDSGGRCTIYNSLKLAGDTVKISKFKVFHNCLPDTVKSSASWYRVNPTDTLKNLTVLRHKAKKDKFVLKGCNVIYPATISLLINDETYVVPLKTKMVNPGIEIWYHGHKRMGRRKERKYENKIADGKPYVYFAATYQLAKYVLSAKFILN